MKRKRKRVETLSAFVRRTRKAKGLSLADVSKQSADLGKPIAGSYVSRIENEPKRKPTPDRLAALANGLGVPVQELLARAVGLAPSGESSDELHLLTRFRSYRQSGKLMS